MSQNKQKVAITPCAGIGQIFGPITREAAYRLVEDLYPEETILVCPPALAVDITEDVNFVKNYPVIVLNGCKDRCGSKLVLEKGGQVNAEIYLPDILKREKLSLHGEKRSRLGPKSLLAIDKLTEAASTVIIQFLEKGSNEDVQAI